MVKETRTPKKLILYPYYFNMDGVFWHRSKFMNLVTEHASIHQLFTIDDTKSKSREGKGKIGVFISAEIEGFRNFR